MGYKNGQLPVTEAVSSSLIRLPLFHSLSTAEQDIILDSLKEFFINPR